MDDDLHDQNLVVNRANRNCALRDPKTDENLDVSLYLHMNDPLGGHSTDDDHRDVLVGHRMNGMDDRNDLNLGVTMDASHDLRTNDRLDDHLKGDDHHDVLVDHRMNGMDDRNDLKTDGNHVNRNYAPRDLMMDANLDGNRDLRKNVMDDPSLGVNRVNRNYAPRVRKLGANLDAMNRRVKLMVYLNMNCDRMSHDHLRYDRQMMLHRDMNRKVGMNLDGKILDGKILDGKILDGTLKNSGAMNSDARMT
jgi:hypothetical protein